jgi:hypothetical protein
MMHPADARDILDNPDEYTPEQVAEANEVLTAAGWE